MEPLEKSRKYGISNSCFRIAIGARWCLPSFLSSDKENVEILNFSNFSGSLQRCCGFSPAKLFQKFRRLASHIFTGTGNEIHNPVSIAVQKIILTEWDQRDSGQSFPKHWQKHRQESNTANHSLKIRMFQNDPVSHGGREFSPVNAYRQYSQGSLDSSGASSEKNFCRSLKIFSLVFNCMSQNMIFLHPVAENTLTTLSRTHS